MPSFTTLGLILLAAAKFVAAEGDPTDICQSGDSTSVACGGQNSLRFCYNRAAVPFDVDCPADASYCCNGKCSKDQCPSGRPPVTDDSCKGVQDGLVCVDFDHFKRCIGEKLYWAPAQPCGPGTSCCNNWCRNTWDTMCEADRKLYGEVSSNSAKSTVAQNKADGKLAEYLNPDVWLNKAPNEWKDYASYEPALFFSHTVNLAGNQTVGLWNFGFRSPIANSNIDGKSVGLVTNAVVLPVYDDGTTAGRPIFSKIMVDKAYSDVWAVYAVTVGQSAVPMDQYKDFMTILQDPVWATAVAKGFVNYPMVPYGTQAKIDPAGRSEYQKSCTKETAETLALKEGWFKGLPVWYFDLGTVSSTSPDSVQVSAGAVLDSNREVTIECASGAAGCNGFYRLSTVESPVYTDYNGVSSDSGTLVASVWNARTMFVACEARNKESSVLAQDARILKAEANALENIAEKVEEKAKKEEQTDKPDQGAPAPGVLSSLVNMFNGFIGGLHF